jgi:hypothetical protein
VLIFLLSIKIVELKKKRLLNIYNEYINIFSEKKIAILPLKNINYKIILQLNIKSPSYRPFYLYLVKELKHLHIYLEEI